MKSLVQKAGIGLTALALLAFSGCSTNLALHLEQITESELKRPKNDLDTIFATSPFLQIGHFLKIIFFSSFDFAILII